MKEEDDKDKKDEDRYKIGFFIYGQPHILLPCTALY